jgi:hypothetical protein
MHKMVNDRNFQLLFKIEDENEWKIILIIFIYFLFLSINLIKNIYFKAIKFK